MSDAATSPVAWWSARRLRYNAALVVSGVLAFITYLAVGFIMLPPEAEFEATIFTTLLQGVGYLFMIGVANIFYLLGPLSERVMRPQDPGRYRRICFCLGLWFSVLLPFSIPALLAFLAIVHREFWRYAP